MKDEAIIFSICNNIYKIAEKTNHQIDAGDGDYHYAYKVDNNEIILIKRSGELDPFYGIKFLRGSFKDKFYCEEGTIYLEFIINKEYSIWGLNVRKKDAKYNKYGTLNEVLFDTDLRVEGVKNYLVKIERDNKIKDILDQ